MRVFMKIDLGQLLPYPRIGSGEKFAKRVTRERKRQGLETVSVYPRWPRASRRSLIQAYRSASVRHSTLGLIGTIRVQTIPSNLTPKEIDS